MHVKSLLTTNPFSNGYVKIIFKFYVKCKITFYIFNVKLHFTLREKPEPNVKKSGISSKNIISVVLYQIFRNFLIFMVW